MSARKPLRPQGGSLAVVAFAPSTLTYLRVLKPGYRHCMVAIQDHSVWQLLDPLSNRFEITHLGELRVDEVLRIFTQSGLDAVCVQRRPPFSCELPWAPFTCVEAVKRVLGLNARWVMTPWQLRRYLARHPGLFIKPQDTDNHP